MSRTDGAKVRIHGKILRESTAAVHFKLDQESNPDLAYIPDEPQWFPLSQISEMHTVADEGNADSLVISLWIADKKGLV